MVFAEKEDLKLVFVEFVLVVIAFGCVLFNIFTHHVDHAQATFLIVFSVISLFCFWWMKYFFMLGYLFSTIAVVTLWRLTVYSGDVVSTWILAAVMVIKLINYAMLAIISIRKGRVDKQDQGLITASQWQLLFIRLYISIDLVPHYSEKLFAGSSVRAADVQSFITLHVSHAVLMVILAGLIEFVGAFCVACGFLTRISSFCLASYLLYATWLGGNFSNGFVWANSPPGWEFPVFWSALIYSFTFFGAGKFSLDHWLVEHCRLPNWILWCMGGVRKKSAATMENAPH